MTNITGGYASEAIDLEAYRVEPIEPYSRDEKWFDIVRVGHLNSGCLIGSHVYAQPSNHFIEKRNLEIWPSIHLLKKDKKSKSAIIHAFEELRRMPIPYHGDLNMMLILLEEGRLENIEAVIDFVCMVDEVEFSAQILSKLIASKKISLEVIPDLIAIQNSDSPRVYAAERKLHKLLFSLSEPEDFSFAFSKYILYKAEGYSLTEKASVFVKYLVRNPNVPNYILEDILYSDDKSFYFLQYEAIKFLQDRKEYSDIPKSMLWKMFQLD